MGFPLVLLPAQGDELASDVSWGRAVEQPEVSV